MAEISLDYIEKSQSIDYTMPVLNAIPSDDWAYCLRNLAYAPRESGETWFPDAFRQRVGIVYRKDGSTPMNIEPGVAAALWAFKSGLIIPSDENEVTEDVTAGDHNHVDLYLFHVLDSVHGTGFWAPLKDFSSTFNIQRVPFGFEHEIAYMADVEARVFHRRPGIVKHGLKFRNCAFRLNRAGDVIRVDHDNRPYLMTLDVDYSDEAADEAIRQLGIVTADAHSRDNLTRWFATPLLSKSREEVFVWYGKGGEGKGSLLSAMEASSAFGPYVGSFDSAVMFGRGGNATVDSNAAEIAPKLWAADGEAPTLDEKLLAGLKKISGDHKLTTRRIGENTRTLHTDVMLTMATNRVPAIDWSEDANSRRLALVAWDNHGHTGRGSTGAQFHEWIHSPGAVESCMMASCRLWETDGWRGPWKDIVIAAPGALDDDLTEWVVRQLLASPTGSGNWVGAPGNPTRADKKRVRDLLGLASTMVRTTSGLVRGYKIADAARFAAYANELEQPEADTLGDMELWQVVENALKAVGAPMTAGELAYTMRDYAGQIGREPSEAEIKQQADIMVNAGALTRTPTGYTLAG